MSLEEDIARLKTQEEKLRFKSFAEDDAWKLGSAMRTRAAERNIPLVIDIRIGNRPMFYVCMPGTTPDNPEWVRRKVNTVMRFHASTYRIGLEHKKAGKAFDESRGIAPLDYAAAGGGFPIHLIGTGVIGAVTVSGIPQRQDHAFVAESIAAFLGVDYASIALAKDET